MLPSIAESMAKDEETGKAFEFFGTFSGSLNPKLDRIHNVGPLDRPLWLEEVAKSKFMVCPYLYISRQVAVGLTRDSACCGPTLPLAISSVFLSSDQPTLRDTTGHELELTVDSAYDALCFGVPFINV